MMNSELKILTQNFSKVNKIINNIVKWNDNFTQEKKDEEIEENKVNFFEYIYKINYQI